MPKHKTSVLLRKKRFRRWWRWSLSASFLIVILYAASFWSAHESIQIKEIKISGNEFISDETIEQIFRESSDIKILGLFDRNNFLFLPKKIIAQKIRHQISVKNVIIRIVEFGRAEIEVIEYEPWGVWCKEERCYFVNKDGLAFIEHQNFTDLIILEGATNQEDLLGLSYTKTNTFNNFILIQKLLHKLEIEFYKISTEDFETFKIWTTEGPQLLVSNKSNPTEIINNLKILLEQESIHKIQFKNIEYIDLRFKDKAYYKIK